MSFGVITAVLAVVAVAALTLGLGAFGLRLSRTTSDFYVASRAVGRVTNAAAISGEYLSAASFLGIAGLVATRGVDTLWYPVGWTAGYLMLLVLVAAPLRRSRAYTLPDFAEFRLQSPRTRAVASALVVLIAVLYLIPQFRDAGLILRVLTGAPGWLGTALVAVIVLLNVVAGGMRSITLAQAVQYWLKLFALLLPLIFLLIHGGSLPFGSDGSAHRVDLSWLEPLQQPHSLYRTYSLIIALFLGTMGLPHVVVRFYTNPDGRTTRRTTLTVLVLLSIFYLLPPVYGILGRQYLGSADATDAAVLALPGRILGSGAGDLLTAVLAAGAFAAFLSTSSGLVLSIAGVIGQDVLGRRVGPISGFRLAGAIAALGTLALTLLTGGLGVAQAVELAFTVAASTFCPLLVLGIWWRGLTAVGAALGMIIGGALSAAAAGAVMTGQLPGGLLGTVVSQPAMITVGVSFLVMIVGSRLTAARQPRDLARIMIRLHTPETVPVDREGFRARGAQD